MSRSSLKTTLVEVERLLSTRTVVGEPVIVGDQTIIPLIAVGFGFGAGGGSGKEQKTTSMEALGAGAGAGGGVKRVAIIIVGKDGVRLENVRRGAANLVEKVGDALRRQDHGQAQREIRLGRREYARARCCGQRP